MNHYETEDGKVVVDVMKFDVAPLFPLPDGKPSTPTTPQARLFRWTFDPSAGQHLQGGAARDRAGEFPRFDERFCMSDYRHGWIVAGNVVDTRTGEPRMDGITHYDPRPARARALRRAGRSLWRADLRAAPR